MVALRVVATAIANGASRFIDDNPTSKPYVALSVIIALGATFANFLLFSGRVTAKLAVQAHFDPLTNLLNRRRFEERAKKELKRAPHTDSHIIFTYTPLPGGGFVAGETELCRHDQALDGHWTDPDCHHQQRCEL